jgi:hypothetical protein
MESATEKGWIFHQERLPRAVEDKGQAHTLEAEGSHFRGNYPRGGNNHNQ